MQPPEQPVEPSPLASDCHLERVGSGLYERQATKAWWAQGGLHGGYILALAMTALGRELEGTGLSLHQIGMQYLRPVQDGVVQIAVTMERQGRRTANATIRIESAGRLAALALGSAVDHQRVGEVGLLGPPPVAPYRPADNTPESAPTLPIQNRVWIQPRDLGDGELARAGPTPPRIGGWIASRFEETTDHRFIGVVVDLLIPAVYGAWDQPHGSPTLDLTYHARASLPREDVPPGGPLLVALTNRVSAGGVVDEDVEVWSESGVLLAQSRQMRLVR